MGQNRHNHTTGAYPSVDDSAQAFWKYPSVRHLQQEQCDIFRENIDHMIHQRKKGPHPSVALWEKPHVFCRRETTRPETTRWEPQADDGGAGLEQRPKWKK